MCSSPILAQHMLDTQVRLHSYLWKKVFTVLPWRSDRYYGLIGLFKLKKLCKDCLPQIVVHYFSATGPRFLQLCVCAGLGKKTAHCLSF